MTNPLRGEVPLGNYTLRFSMNAIVSIEKAMGASIQEIATRMGESNPPMDQVRALVMYGLRDRHPDITEEEAGEAATEFGIVDTLEAVGQAFSLAFEKRGGTSEGAAAASTRPQKRASTG